MSSETRTESQLKNNEQEIQQQEQPHGILETLSAAVSNTVESAKEAVFGKDESSSDSQQQQPAATEESGILASMLSKAKEVVFGSEEEPSLTEKASELGSNLSERAADLKENLAERASNATEAAKAYIPENITERAAELKENITQRASDLSSNLSERAADLKENLAERASNVTEAAKDYLPAAASEKKVDSDEKRQESREEKKEERSEEQEEEVEAPHIPSHIRPAVKVGGRRIVQADHPHLIAQKPVKEELREKLGEEAKSDESSSSTELTKEQEERQLAVKQQTEKMEKLALNSTKHHADSKAFPSSYQRPQPTHDNREAPRFESVPREFPSH